MLPYRSKANPYVVSMTRSGCANYPGSNSFYVVEQTQFEKQVLIPHQFDAKSFLFSYLSE
jgi:hypothetical protein